MSSLDIQVVLYERPKYVPGTGPPMLPVTLALPTNGTDYFIADKITLNLRPIYVISRHGNPTFRQACRLDSVLDWVSRKVYEDFEFGLTKVADQARRDEEDGILARQKEGSRQKGRVGRPRKDVPRKDKEDEFIEIAKRIEKNRRKQDIHRVAGGILSKGTDKFEMIDEDDENLPIKRNIGRPRKRKILEKSATGGPASKRQLYSTSPALPHRNSLPGSARSQPSLSQLTYQDDLSNDENGDFGYLTRESPTISKGLLMPPRLGGVRRSSLLITQEESSQSSTQRSSRSVFKATPRPELRRVMKSTSSEDSSVRSGVPQLSSSGNLLASIDFGEMSGQKSRKPYASRRMPTEHMLRPTSSHSQILRPAAISGEALFQKGKEREKKPSSFKLRSSHERAEDLLAKSAEEDLVWTLKGIIAHEIRKIRGRHMLYYLVDWECEYEGQWAPSWEPSKNVSDDAKKEYHEQLREAVKDELGDNSDDREAMGKIGDGVVEYRNGNWVTDAKVNRVPVNGMSKTKQDDDLQERGKMSAIDVLEIGDNGDANRSDERNEQGSPFSPLSLSNQLQEKGKFSPYLKAATSFNTAQANIAESFDESFGPSTDIIQDEPSDEDGVLMIVYDQWVLNRDEGDTTRG